MEIFNIGNLGLWWTFLVDYLPSEEEEEEEGEGGLRLEGEAAAGTQRTLMTSDHHFDYSCFQGKRDSDDDSHKVQKWLLQVLRGLFILHTDQNCRRCMGWIPGGNNSCNNNNNGLDTKWK